MDISRRVFAGVSNIFLGLLISPAISADFSLLHFLLSIHLKSISIFRIGCPSWRNSLRSSSSPGVILSAAGSYFLLACDWSSCSGHDAPRDVCPQGCGSSMAAPLGHALAPAGMRGERLEFLASGVSAEIEVKTTWRRNA